MKKTLKVAHVLSELSGGGMEKVIADMVTRFDRERIDPLVCCVLRKGEHSERLEHNGIKVVAANKSKYPAHAAISLSKIFREEEVDIVHSYSGIYRDAVLGGLLSRTPIIIHTDQGKFYPDTRWSRFNHWFFSNFRDRVIAVSNELRDFLTKEVKISSKKTITIYNGVDTDEYKVNIDVNIKKEKLGLPLNQKIIGIVARLVPVKDHKTLFMSFKKVRETFLDVKLLVIGSGPLERELKSFAASLSEDENIIFLGKRDDIRELLHVIDVICLSSLHEGLSLTLAEAMASGKPVVATDVGGNPELVLDGINGFLVPAKNHEKMAEAIIKLLNDDNQRGVMGKAGRERIKEKFDIKQIVREHENLYINLARQKGIL